MSKIDTNKIIEMTNLKIGYDNFEREEFMKKQKLKKVGYAFLIVGILSIGTFTVNAATDNAIGEVIKKIVTIKVDGEDKNANCTKNEDGTITCKVEDENSGIYEYTISEDGQSYNYDVDVNTKNNESEIIIKDTIK